MKKRHTLFIILGLLLTTSCNLNCITGKGPLVTKKIEVNDFTKIIVDCSANVVLTQGNSTSVSIEAQDNIHDLIQVDVEGDELTVDMEGCSSNTLGITVHITVPLIEELTTDGSGDISTTNTFKQNNAVEINIEGSGDISFSSETKEIEVNIDGSGDVNLNGSADRIGIYMDGSGDVNAKELKAKNGNVSIDGSGDVEINAKDTLEIEIDGSGDVHYIGSPRLKTSIDGSGDIGKI